MSIISTPECLVCVETFNTTVHKPMLLSCAHGLCSYCVDKLARETSDDVVRCPTCRRITARDRTLINRPLLDIISSLSTANVPRGSSQLINKNEVICDLCIREDCISPPTMHCFQCEHWLCSLHASRHARQQNHTDVHSFAEIQAQYDLQSCVDQQLRPIIQSCSAHASSLLNQHCIDCNQLVCWKCVDESHGDHRHEEISTAYCSLITAAKSVVASSTTLQDDMLTHHATQLSLVHKQTSMNALQAVVQKITHVVDSFQERDRQLIQLWQSKSSTLSGCDRLSVASRQLKADLTTRNYGKIAASLRQLNTYTEECNLILCSHPSVHIPDSAGLVALLQKFESDLTIQLSCSDGFAAQKITHVVCSEDIPVATFSVPVISFGSNLPISTQSSSQSSNNFSSINDDEICARLLNLTDLDQTKADEITFIKLAPSYDLSLFSTEFPERDAYEAAKEGKMPETMENEGKDFDRLVAMISRASGDIPESLKRQTLVALLLKRAMVAVKRGIEIHKEVPNFRTLEQSGSLKLEEVLKVQAGIDAIQDEQQTIVAEAETVKPTWGQYVLYMAAQLNMSPDEKKAMMEARAKHIAARAADNPAAAAVQAAGAKAAAAKAGSPVPSGGDTPEAAKRKMLTALLMKRAIAAVGRDIMIRASLPSIARLDHTGMLLEADAIKARKAIQGIQEEQKMIVVEADSMRSGWGQSILPMAHEFRVNLDRKKIGCQSQSTSASPPRSKPTFKPSSRIRQSLSHSSKTFDSNNEDESSDYGGTDDDESTSESESNDSDSKRNDESMYRSGLNAASQRTEWGTEARINLVIKDASSQNKFIAARGIEAIINLARTNSQIGMNKMKICTAGGIEAIIDGMKHHVGVLNVQKSACEALAILSAGNKDTNTRKISDAGGIEAIIDSMKHHLNVSGVQQVACQTLDNLCINKEANQFKIGDAGGIEAIIDGMKHHVNVSDVQQVACRALVNLSYNNEANSIKIGDTCGIEAIIDSMKHHVIVSHVQQNACQALGCLSYNNEANSIKIGDAGGIEAIIDSMKHHLNVSDVQLYACQALRCLSYNEVNRVKIGDTDGIEAIIDGMKHHVNVSGVQQVACQALVNLSYNNEANKIKIGTVAGIEAIIDSMKHHVNVSGVQQVACQALVSLSYNNEANRVKIGDAGGIEAIIDGMKHHVIVSHVQQNACQALGCLSNNNEANRVKIGDAGGIEAIIDGMKHHVIVSDVQQNACWALVSLSDNNEANSIKIGDAGGIEAIIDSMKHHVIVSGVQQNACSALFNIGYAGNFEIGYAGGIEAIIDGMKHHVNVSGVQKVACLVLACLSNNNKSRKSEIGAAGGVETIIDGMKHHVNVSDVQEFACGALACLLNNETNQIKIVEITGVGIFINPSANNNANQLMISASHGTDEIQRKIVAAGGIEAIIDGMKHHVNVSDVQQNACFVLAHLSNNNDENKHNIRAAGGIEAIIDGMKNHVQVSDVQQNALLVLDILNADNCVTPIINNNQLSMI